MQIVLSINSVMNVINTEINDLYFIDYFSNADRRGVFVKNFHAPFFLENNLEYSFEESFYSVSKSFVIRGMHFQKPPNDHIKLVTVIQGEILDVVLDIRKNSKSYGRFVKVLISSNQPRGIYIGKGLAHGFMSLEDNTIVGYHTSKVYHPECDMGVRFDSFGFKWPTENPIVSDRDNDFIPFDMLQSPFI